MSTFYKYIIEMLLKLLSSFGFDYTSNAIENEPILSPKSCVSFIVGFALGAAIKWRYRRYLNRRNAANCRELVLVPRREIVIHPINEENLRISEKYRNKGNGAFHSKNYQKAVRAYTKALRYTPNSETLYNNRGVAYMKMQFHDKAVESFDFVLKNLNVRNVDSWVLKAVSLFKGGHRNSFERCIEEAKTVIIEYQDRLDDVSMKIRMGII